MTCTLKNLYRLRGLFFPFTWTIQWQSSLDFQHKHLHDKAMRWQIISPLSAYGKICFIYLLSKNHSIHSIFTPWVVTSVITSFWSEYRVNRPDETSLAEYWIFTLLELVRIEWNSLLNEWNLFTPYSIDGVNYSLDFFQRVQLYLSIYLYIYIYISIYDLSISTSLTNLISSTLPTFILAAWSLPSGFFFHLFSCTQGYFNLYISVPLSIQTIYMSLFLSIITIFILIFLNSFFCQ